MTHDAPSALRLRQLRKVYGRQIALDALDLDVMPGEIVGLLGPNGAGKTTTLGIVAGLIHKTSGTVEMLGRSSDISSPGARRHVGFLVGPPAHWPHLSGHYHLEMLGKLIGVPRPREEADSLLNAVGLSEQDGRRRTAHYSEGMRQRLGIALALVGKPRLLVLDEPTNGLDPLAGPEIWSMLQRRAHEDGCAILVSTHLLDEVEEWCDRAPLLHKGRLISPDALADLRAPGRARSIRLRFLPQVSAQSVLDAARRITAGHSGAAQWSTPADAHPVLRVELPPESLAALVADLALAGCPPIEVIPERLTLPELFREMVSIPPAEHKESR